MSRELPVTAVMTSPVTTVTSDTTVEEAVALLVGKDFGGVPVVDADERLVGLLDDSDLLVSEARLHGPTTIEILGAYIPLPGELQRFHDEVRAALGQVVGDVMDREPPVVDTRATVEDVATLIHSRGVTRVPVVDEQRRVVGIVTRGDLVRSLQRSEQGSGGPRA